MSDQEYQQRLQLLDEALRQQDISTTEYQNEYEDLVNEYVNNQ